MKRAPASLAKERQMLQTEGRSQNGETKRMRQGGTQAGRFLTFDEEKRAVHGEGGKKKKPRLSLPSTVASPSLMVLLTLLFAPHHFSYKCESVGGDRCVSVCARASMIVFVFVTVTR